MMRTPAVLTGVGAVLLVAIGLVLGLDVLALARLAILGAALGQVVYHDLREHRIPNRVVLPATVLCVALSIVDGVQFTRLAVGALLVVLLLVVSLARPAWIGMGDVKLVLLMLCALHAATPLAVAVAVELYAALALVLIARRGRAALRMALPLAPFMAVGSLLALVV
jgi:leader peptidase (prepilin peptidase)/N-methyltransferase